uniref:Non-specific lipid-transfer protein n=2 Tax=Cucumis melo TaxID=3656 RepID=A0A9I9DTV3_CUCME
FSCTSKLISLIKLITTLNFELKFKPTLHKVFQKHISHTARAMATIPKLGAILLFVFLLLGVSKATISCSDVTKDLMPCVSYLVSGSGKPPSACCDGAKALSSAATSGADKKAACQCIKSAASNVNYNAKLAQDLPSNCGITLPFSISAGIDCSKIN